MKTRKSQMLIRIGLICIFLFNTSCVHTQSQETEFLAQLPTENQDLLYQGEGSWKIESLIYNQPQ